MIAVFAAVYLLDEDRGVPPALRGLEPMPEPTVEDFRSVETPKGTKYWPRSAPLVEGVKYSYNTGHCGLDFMTDFDGAFWIPNHEEGEPTPRFFFNEDEGTLTVLSHERALYRSAEGGSALLIRHEGPLVVKAPAGNRSEWGDRYRVSPPQGYMKRTLVVLILLSASIGASGVAARPTCFGEAATIVGTAGDDRELRGDRGADVIVGLGGADTIHGKGGNDRICGGKGTTRSTWDFECGDPVGSDRMSGGPGRDILMGEACPPNGRNGRSDVLVAGGGRDVVAGGSGNDNIDGGPGTDVFWLHGYRSTINLASRSTSGAEGSDRLSDIENVTVPDCRFEDYTVIGSAGTNVIKVGEGDDVVRAGGGEDYIYTGDENSESQCRGDGDNRIFGGDGPDHIWSSSGDDYLHGGPGNDGATAGGGRDRCVEIEQHVECEVVD